MTKNVEYRVRPVTRYIVTRYENETFTTEYYGQVGHGMSAGSLQERGEYANADVAHEVAYALCKAEHDASGEPIDSMNFIYPKRD